MSKTYGLFVLNNSLYSKLPWELKNQIISYLYSTQMEYIILNYPLNWNYRSVSSFVRMDFAVQHLDLYWSMPSLCLNNSLRIEHIKKLSSEIDFLGWSFVSQNRSLTTEDILQNDFPWDIEYLVTNPSIDLEKLMENMEITPNELSKAKMPIEYIRKHPDNLDWSKLSALHKTDILLANRDLPWDWKMASHFCEIRHVIAAPELWDYKILSTNENIPVTYLLSGHEINWFNLSYRNDLTFEQIIANKNKEWNWLYLSTCAPLKYLDKDLPWCWSFVLENPNITLDYVLTHDKPWDWTTLSQNITITQSDIENNLHLPLK